ncbi:hypothetical protein, partial [Promicromonospora sp. NPDC057488]|uniref:hypothetical protein n=1 Tax=Promicromonospora sp. NPDC057488 TaxID=3346147 RepID=UPI00367338A2
FEVGTGLCRPQSKLPTPLQTADPLRAAAVKATVDPLHTADQSHLQAAPRTASVVAHEFGRL